MWIDSAIIGAGISGLSCRQVLNKSALKIRVFEKSRGSGGRMATRRGEGWVADLGAQCVELRDPSWKDFLQAQGSQMIVSDQYSIHRQGMSALMRAWMLRSGEGSEVEFQAKVMKLNMDSNLWKIQLESGVEWNARTVVLTAPVPQAMELMQNSGLVLSENCERLLSTISFSSCLAVVVPWISSPTAPLSAIWKNPSPKISGIYQQMGKGIRMDSSIPEVSVIHASPSWSRELWDRESSDQIAEILKAVDPLFGSQGKFLDSKKAILHRWRYCEPLQIHPEPFFKVEFADPCESAPLLLAGDAFGRSSMEGAFVSGRSAGHYILKYSELFK